MSNYEQFLSKKKNQTLLLVEGKHERDEMLYILLKVFPEIPINMENIHVFSADIYDLYQAIENEYEKDWFENDSEIDVPMLISRRLNIEPQLDKRNFTNIILMFDYDHHDTSFTDDKIKKMQSHFNSISGDGILYINYPMIESYQHIFSIPDLEYLGRKVSVTCSPGSKYKNGVHEKSVFWRYLTFYRKLVRCLEQVFSGANEECLENAINGLLIINDNNTLEERVEAVLKDISAVTDYRTLKYMIVHQIQELGYITEGMGFYTKIRQIFMYTAVQNIIKAWKVQNANDAVGDLTIKEMYYEINFDKILEQQNMESKDPIVGMIWVLCTCITLLGEYKFFWKDK